MSYHRRLIGGDPHDRPSCVATSVHLAAELFKAMAGVNIVLVPYKGMGPALVDLIAWWGILAPAGTPGAVVTEINGELARALSNREVTGRIAALGADLVGGPPERLAEHLQAEIPKWRKVVRAANIRL